MQNKELKTSCTSYLNSMFPFPCNFLGLCLFPSPKDSMGKDTVLLPCHNYVDQACTSQNIFWALISDQSEASSILEQDLRDLLSLGAATKAFMLALVKTGRLKVAGKNIMFLNSA